MSLTASEIEDAILGYEYTVSYPEISWSTGRRVETGKTISYTETLDWHDLWCDGTSDPIQIPGVGRLEVVATHGGEGQGDQAWVVVSITDAFGDVKLYRKDGYYSSFEGADFDSELREVVVKEKVVSVYE